MTIPRLLSLGVLLALLVKQEAPQTVALVYSLAGEVSVTTPGALSRSMRLFDRFPSGTKVEVGPKARLALAFTNGRRYELGEDSKVTLGKKDLIARSGPVRALPSVPPLPRLSPIAADDNPGPKAGAVRIRGERITGLYPCCGATALAGETVLRFEPAAGVSRYRTEVQDARGTVIFRTVTEGFFVSVPGKALSPDASYHWTVKALDRPGPVVSGEADFVTLSTDAAEDRRQLREAAEKLDDARGLLDAVDHALGLAGGDPQTPGGAVVESVAPGSPGEKAGLQPGDTILEWSCAARPPSLPQPSSGTVRSPYDLVPLESEEAPRRAVTLRGKRGDQEMLWTLPAGEWRLETRPVAEHAAWLRHRRARELAKAGTWAEADAAYEEALAALERELELSAAAQLLREWGNTFFRRAAWEAAAERYQRALALDQRTRAKSLAAARTLNGLAMTATERGDYTAADAWFRQALAIQEELAPGSAAVTLSLNNLGILARRRSDLAAAEEYLSRGEELQRQLAPDGVDHALFFQNLGNVSRDRGDLERAEGFHRKALAIFEKTSPGGARVLDCLSNLTDIAIQRGNLATAEHLLHEALGLHDRRAPDEPRVSRTRIGLGYLAERRGDLEDAEAHYQQALKIQQKLSPDGLNTAAILANLGTVAARRRDPSQARSYLLRSLAIEEKLAPGSVNVAARLRQLGRLETESGGDPGTAEDLLRRSLAIYEDQAPQSLGASGALRGLGEVVSRSGRLEEGIGFHRRALDIQRNLAPESTGEAEALLFLGRAERRAGRHEEGTRDLCGAIDILDRQRTRLGGSPESKNSFEASVGDFYHACLEGLIQLGRAGEAFHALERGRARSFLSLLAERDLRFSDLPPELAAERRHVNADYDRTQAQLARLSAGRDDAEIERLAGRLRELRVRQELIVATLRQAAPRSAALQEPVPLDQSATRKVLDPGTVLLGYAVGPERTWLFVVQAAAAPDPGLSIFPIGAGTKALREEVETFRRLLNRPTSDRATLQARASRLYDLLVRPAEGQIAKARRLLVSPDGPLHTLPFAALIRRGRYLIEWKPIHSVLSITVYSELAHARPAGRSSGGERFVAFADPVYPSMGPEGLAEPEVRDAVRRGLALKSLPASRREAETIAGLYSQARTYLGRDATEENAKALGPQTRLLHFACHGLLDERFPLNSALALTLPEHPTEGQDNGLLQAWEIFESVRLDADLVTLSACDTALGKEMGGEGLVGLTRAFQYAGARSVLASLWSVADVSTADLMQRFYGHLRAGKSKDEALQAAQIELIRSPHKTLSHPYHWAAFQLVGDWR